MYSNNILNFQESTTILNASTKKFGNLLNVNVWVQVKSYMTQFQLDQSAGDVAFTYCISARDKTHLWRVYWYMTLNNLMLGH